MPISKKNRRDSIRQAEIKTKKGIFPRRNWRKCEELYKSLALEGLKPEPLFSEPSILEKATLKESGGTP